MSFILQWMSIVSTELFNACVQACATFPKAIKQKYFVHFSVIHTDTCFADNLDRDSLFHQECSSKVYSGIPIAVLRFWSADLHKYHTAISTTFTHIFRIIIGKTAYSTRYPPYFYDMPKVSITHFGKKQCVKHLKQSSDGQLLNQRFMSIVANS